MHYASISRRLGALLLDAIFICVPLFFLHAALPFLGGVAALFLYHAVFESSALQATPGKYLMGILVTDQNGQTLTIRAASIRLLIKVLSSAMMFIGHFFALFNSRHQALHDLIAESVVIYGRREVHWGDAWLAQVKAILGSKNQAAG